MRVSDSEWADLQARLQAWRESLDSVEPPPPPPPPPPPEPTPTGDVQMFGSDIGSLHFNTGPADTSSRAVIEAAIAATPPWTVFGADQTISPSQDGVRATQFVKLHVWGNMNGLYKGIPALIDGAFRQLAHSHFYTPGGDFAAFLTTWGARPGPRGSNLTTAYTTWHGHTRRKSDGTLALSPQVPLYVGVQMDGQVVYAMRDGSVVHPFKIPGAKNTHDFTFFEPDRKVFFVADTDNNRILKIDRNVTPWAVSVYVSVPRPTSIRCLPDGTMFVCSGEQKVLKVVDGVVSDFASIPLAFWVDVLSDGRVLVAARTRGVYLFDQTGAVTVLNAPNGETGWITVSVDRNGTFGPRDEFTMIAMGGVGNTDYWRYQDGQLKYGNAAIRGGFGLCTVGDAGNCQDLFGHYLWVAEHHPDEALLMVQGLSDVFPSLVAARPSHIAPEDVYDHSLMGRGRNLIRQGTVDTMVGQKPSFTAQICENGWSLVGCTADSIAEKSYADAAAFVRQGMLGNYRRDEFTADDIKAILYLIYRSSQRFLKEGKPLMDGVRAFIP